MVSLGIRIKAKKLFKLKNKIELHWGELKNFAMQERLGLEKVSKPLLVVRIENTQVVDREGAKVLRKMN